ncbi:MULTISPECIES: fimbrial protein [Providencia]|jgi:type 1 fimbria pilin|uniref:fimbrial protein n=1 Tax=Providencia TaxID=586 RepID=UPI001C5AA670|nr:MULTISPECIES: fimbrial protein [Providencia]MDR2225459.1 fimbrial protein [Providencia sp.]QXX82245.1 fimbrial protein [Providencia sp. R33]
MNKLIYHSILAVGCMYLYSGYAEAGCTQNPNFNNIQVNIPSATYNIQYDDLSSRDLGQLDVRYLSGASSYTYLDGSTCGTSYLRGNFINNWVPTNKIAPSNIPGIGLSVQTAAIGDFDQVWGPSNPTKNPWEIFSTSWIITIKKTGQVTTSNTIRAGSVARLTQTNSSPVSTWYLTTLNMPANAIRINVLSCSLKSPVPTINLGDWYDTQFPTVGSTSTEVDIPITLTCLAGTNIKATITATSGTINATQGQLALSGGADKATGVAIQIVDTNKNPIPLNSKRTIRDNVAAGDYIFGWKARYIKTADKITPGPANGTATINIRYE